MMELIELKQWVSLPSEIEKAGLKEGFTVGMFSDHLITGKWISVEDAVMKEHPLVQLECLRIFNDKHELKLFKKDGRIFCRDSGDYKVTENPDAVPADAVSSDKVQKEIVNSLIEKQFLDIDIRKTKNLSEVYAIGGGRYCLEGSGLDPGKMHRAKVVLEDYVRYYESGQAYVCDYRIVGFENGETTDEVRQ